MVSEKKRDAGGPVLQPGRKSRGSSGSRRTRLFKLRIPRIAAHPGYRKKVVLWLVLPAVLCETLVYLLPVGVGIYTSFTDVTYTTLRHWLTAPFVGINNYRLTLATPAIAGPLIRSFVLSIIYVTLVVAGSLCIGTLAVVMVRTLKRATHFFQLLYILPFTIPVYAGVLTWDFIVQPNGAAVGLLGHGLHIIKSTALLLEGTNAFWSMLITTIWRSWPFAFLMLLAASQQIPPELYEAVRVDGGGHWRETLHVTLPYLKSTLVTLSLILFLWTFNDFTTPYVLFGEAPPPDADLFPLHVYTNTFVNASYSLGSAMTLLAVILLLAVGLPYTRLSGILRSEDA
jgi:multiple sugar transport system permease protein